MCARYARVLAVVGAVVLLSGCAYERQRAHRDSKLVLIRTELGAGFLERGQIGLAQDEVKKALAINPDDSEANNVMALVQARLKRNAQAEKYFQRAVDANPANSGAQNNFGVFLCQTGHTHKALRHFAKAAADPLNPSRQWANVNAGSCLLRDHEPLAAQNYFRDALAVEPGMGAALLGLGRARWAVGDAPGAEGYLQQYFEAPKPSAEGLMLGIQVEHALGHRDRQATYALRLMTRYPNSSQAKQLQQLTSQGAL